jgi:hypothetical protein
MDIIKNEWSLIAVVKSGSFVWNGWSRKICLDHASVLKIFCLENRRRAAKLA